MRALKDFNIFFVEAQIHSALRLAYYEANAKGQLYRLSDIQAMLSRMSQLLCRRSIPFSGLYTRKRCWPRSAGRLSLLPCRQE